jgi:hypothetical protein
MNPPFDRKAALRAYKEKKPRPGIYAVRHIGTGRAWVGSNPNLDTTQNGLWLQLNQGRHLNRSLQAEWSRWGEGAFEFVILEIFEEGMGPSVLRESLKAKQAEWEASLRQEVPGP